MRVLTLLLLFGLAACTGEDRSAAPAAPQFSYSCVEFLCTFDASATGNTSGGAYYYWDFGDDAQGNGMIASHGYSVTEEVDVVLTVVNSSGTPASITREIAVTGNAAAPYFNAVHDSFAVLLLQEDLMPSIISTIDAIQDEVEVRGNPLENGYTFECPQGGTVDVISWTDTDNSLVIDGAETLSFEAAGCRFGAPEDALTTVGSVQVGGDFDSNSFSIGEPDNAQLSRLGIAGVPRWSIQGAIDVTTTRNTGAIETFTYHSDDLRTFHLTQTGAVDLALRTPLNLTSNFNDTTGISGTLTIRFPGTVPTIYYSEISQALDISTVNGAPELQAGKIGIYFGSNRIDASMNADPAYLKIEVDTSDDGDIDITEQFLQSISVKRLEN